MLHLSRLLVRPASQHVIMLNPSSLLRNKPGNLVTAAKNFAPNCHFSTTRQNLTKKFRSKVISRGKPVKPIGHRAIGVGQASVAGASLLGLGSLCYYGIGMSSKPGLIDEAALWPAHVKQRIRAVYFYFAASIASTGAAAYAISQNPVMFRLFARNGMMASFMMFGAVILSSMIVQNIKYRPGFGPKQLALIAHTCVLGGIIAPLCVIGGPAIIRALTYTAGCCGGLSAIAVCAPSEKFLNWGGPLAAGLGVVFLSSIGSMFFPPTGKAGLTLFSIAMYGGLIIFCIYLLHDTQRIIYNAKSEPGFDPVNHSMSIYMDAINIFIRLAVMSGMGGGSRK